jgi:hypothetical protein
VQLRSSHSQIQSPIGSTTPKPSLMSSTRSLICRNRDPFCAARTWREGRQSASSSRHPRMELA